jgi:hypothetical protein
MTAGDDMERIARDVAQIRKDVDSVLHGNGRKGLWALSDAVFGPPDKSGPGLVAQVKELAHAREAEANQRIGSERTLKQIRALVLFLIAAVGVGGGVAVNRLFELVAALP